MAETWHFRGSGEVACGPMPLGALSQTPASGLGFSSFFGPGGAVCWNRTETARRIAAGTWTVDVILTANDSGRSVQAVIDRRDSACGVLSTIFDQTIPLNASAEELYTVSQSVAFTDFDADDILVIRFEPSHTDGTIVIHYGNTGMNRSKLTHPDTLPPISGRPKIVAGEVYMPGFRAAENAILKGSSNG